LTAEVRRDLTSPSKVKPPFLLGERRPSHAARRDLGQRTPMALETNGTVREARGLTSST
jgi:hypothetical protein